MKTKILFCVLLLVAGYSCKTKETQQTEAQITITPAGPENFVSDLIPYIDSIAIVPLEATEESLLANIFRMLILPDGNFIIPGEQLLVFNPEGKYLFSLGQHGRGPEEYNGNVDFCLSQNGKEIWILTSTEELVGYDIESRKFIRRIKPEKLKQDLSFEAIASGHNGSFFLFIADMQETSGQDFKNILHVSADGKQLNSYLPQKDYIFNIALITQSYDNQYILRPQNADNICYYLKDSIPVPRVKIDFGSKTAPNRLSTDIQTYFHSDYNKMPIYIHETTEQFFFTYCGPETREHYCIHSFATNKTITWKRTGNDSNALFQILSSDPEFFYGIYHDYRSPDEIPLAEIDLLKKAIIEKTHLQLSENSNPYLVKIKFKL